MKTLYLLPCLLAALFATSLSASDYDSSQTIHLTETGYWEKVPDVAQYGGGDWSQVVSFSKRISLARAKEIAAQDDRITYFFYVKGIQMVLGDVNQDFNIRVFHHGDTVFFSGTPWWGSAPELADGYIKVIAE